MAEFFCKQDAPAHAHPHFSYLRRECLLLNKQALHVKVVCNGRIIALFYTVSDVYVGIFAYMYVYLPKTPSK